MERTGNGLPGALRRILLLAAAFALVGTAPACFTGGESCAAAAAGFKPADYRVCGITTVRNAGGQSQYSAIIESLKTGQQGLYRPGDLLSGARIDRIEKNSVILTVGEKRYVLYRETTAPAATAQWAGGPAAAAAAQDAVHTRPTPPQRYIPPGPLAPEPTIEGLLKKIEEEQREQPR